MPQPPVASANAPARGASRPAVRDSVWGARELLWALVARNLRMRYQRTALGFLWVLVNPVITTLILVGVFRYVFRAQVEQYWTFFISGYFAWIFVVHSVTACAGTIREHSYMTKTLAFPADVLVLSTIASRVIEFAFEILLVAGVLAVFRHGGVPLGYLLLPVAVVLMSGMALAIAYPMAALTVFFRDVEFGLPVGLTMLGYLSPVFYPVSLVPEAWRGVYALNPMVGVLGLFRTILYDGVLPSLAGLLTTTVMVAALVAAGLVAFRWKRSLFAEVT